MKAASSTYADLLLPLPLAGVFTYSVPVELRGEIAPGKRVIVQFGRKKVYPGIVKALHDNEPTGYETKEILSVLDSEPVVLPIQLEFWDWIASYYMCASGEVLKAAMAGGLKLEGGQKLAWKEKTETLISLHPSVADEETLNQLLTRLEKAPRQLELLHNYLRLSGFAGKPVARKPVDGEPVAGKPIAGEPVAGKPVSREPVAGSNGKQNSPPELAKSLVVQDLKSSAGPVRALINKNILTETSRPVSRLAGPSAGQREISMLNSFQEEAMDSIKNQFRTKDVVLLNGITSAGKTEIYIHLIKEQLEKGKQVLYLLPEIALTTQIIVRLKHIFGEQAGVYHSRFSADERVEIWNRVLSGEPGSYSLILGVRSSLFLPFSNLGLVIIDEEHENTFKQFDPAPRYHARDAAIMLASMHGAKTLLGTATPSVESWYNTLSGKYGLVNLTKRYKEIELPGIIIADTRRARKRKQMKSLFTPQLMEAISEALAAGEQVILFQNRRGYAPFIECEECGWVPVCQYCDVNMTYHKGISRMVCHYCGASQKTASVCPDCGSSGIKTRGFGTEKIEDEVSLFFPEARAGRLDLDSARGKRSHERIISSFEDGKIDILAGTQMIAKGLDFGRVSLVGILNADNMLLFPDFRAHERSFQLMSQVSGRAGRRAKRGKVVIQTGFPDHPVIKNIIDNNLEKHFKEQLAERKQFKYPPYVRLIRIVIKNTRREVAEKAAGTLAGMLRAKFGNRVLGPEYPPVGKVQNRYLMHILIKIEKGANLPKARSIIAAAIAESNSKPAFRSCQIYPDIDPV